jgi:hypothetical protein
MDVCLLWVLCVVMQKSLRRADHSSRGVLPRVVCLCVFVKPRCWEGPGPLRGFCATKILSTGWETAMNLLFVSPKQISVCLHTFRFWHNELFIRHLIRRCDLGSKLDHNKR